MPRGIKKIQIRNKQLFNPDRNYIQQAVEIFLSAGKKIKRLDPTQCNFQSFLLGTGAKYDREADDFLRS